MAAINVLPGSSRRRLQQAVKPAQKAPLISSGQHRTQQSRDHRYRQEMIKKATIRAAFWLDMKDRNLPVSYNSGPQHHAYDKPARDSSDLISPLATPPTAAPTRITIIMISSQFISLLYYYVRSGKPNPGS